MHFEEDVPGAVEDGAVHSARGQQGRHDVRGIGNYVSTGVGEVSNHSTNAVAESDQE